MGRYAYDQQPGIGLWNLQALAVALQSLMPWEAINASLRTYVPHFVATYERLTRAKIGLVSEQEGDEELTDRPVRADEAEQGDYPQSFRLLAARATTRPGALDGAVRRGHAARRFRLARPLAGAHRGRAGRLAEAAARMNRVNPKFVLRNWVAETAIRAVEDDGDVATLDRIFRLVTHPFDEGRSRTSPSRSVRSATWRISRCRARREPQGFVTRLSVRLIRPPCGSSVEEPGMMRSMP